MDGIAVWEATDWEAFRAFYASFQPAGLPAYSASSTGEASAATGWLGIFPETQFIEPRPSPSGMPSQPTIYGRFTFDHAWSRATVEGVDAPCRGGTLSTAIRLELGADERWVRGPAGVYSQLRQHMVDSSTPTFAIFPEGVTERHGQDGDFAVYVLRTKFISTN